MTIHAFVFARGGSKGVPGKNLRLIAGVSLVGRAIDLANSLTEVDEVWVSTDDERIAAEAQEHGATVIDRPAELAQDDSAEWLAWRHAIAHVLALRGQFDTFLSLPATSPLRNADDVRACLAALSPQTDIVLSMTPAARNPWYNMVTVDPTGHLALASTPDVPLHRRQDAPLVYDLTTVAYVARPSFILEHGRIWDGTVAGVVIPRERAIDIDDEVDLAIAEVLFARSAQPLN